MARQCCPAVLPAGEFGCRITCVEQAEEIRVLSRDEIVPTYRIPPLVRAGSGSWSGSPCGASVRCHSAIESNGVTDDSLSRLLVRREASGEPVLDDQAFDAPKLARVRLPDHAAAARLPRLGEGVEVGE